MRFIRRTLNGQVIIIRMDHSFQTIRLAVNFELEIFLERKLLLRGANKDEEIVWEWLGWISFCINNSRNTTPGRKLPIFGDIKD